MSAAAHTPPSHPLALWLERRGWTQAELARAAGVSQQYVSDLLHRRRRPSLAVAIRLHGVTGIPIPELAA